MEVDIHEDPRIKDFDYEIAYHKRELKLLRRMRLKLLGELATDSEEEE